MKRFIVYIVVLMALTACAALRIKAPEPTATSKPLVNMPNPASLFCEQKGNQLEIRTAPDGSQSGICVFPDGSTCDEWAYFRGECGLAPQESPTPDFAVEKTTPESSDGTEGNTLEEHASGGYMAPGTPEKLTDWWGVIKRAEPGSQYDDYFERQDFGPNFIYFGIDSTDPAVQAQIEELRDSGKIVHLYGTLLSNVPDYNGSQIQVDRIEVEG